MKCYDEGYYERHEHDTPDRCFLCGDLSEGLSVVRHIASMKMVHLCAGCMTDRMSEYLLDNTRAWKGKVGKTEVEEAVRNFQKGKGE
ncbi:MAG: hypothetical protein Q7J01_08265 [Syntrophales bacterium]|nr:hypothetical protein [Syntrophales bacterium]